MSVKSIMCSPSEIAPWALSTMPTLVENWLSALYTTAYNNHHSLCQALSLMETDKEWAVQLQNTCLIGYLCCQKWSICCCLLQYRKAWHPYQAYSVALTNITWNTFCMSGPSWRETIGHHRIHCTNVLLDKCLSKLFQMCEIPSR